jgi:hypothetical protein
VAVAVVARGRSAPAGAIVFVTRGAAAATGAATTGAAVRGAAGTIASSTVATRGREGGRGAITAAATTAACSAIDPTMNFPACIAAQHTPAPG